MWQIHEKPFITDKDIVEKARNTLREALAHKMLTLVVGNGPTRSATLLDPRPGVLGDLDTGWEAAVQRVARNAGVPGRLRQDKNVNLLALAQAVLKKRRRGRELLIDAFKAELERPIKPTLIHEMIAVLAPHFIVTTNYDLQIERVLEKRGLDWQALVRETSMPENVRKRAILVIKMHGSLNPDHDLASNYFSSHPKWKETPRDSIVIAESDYYECMHGLRNSAMESPRKNLLFDALEKVTLVVGKSVPWQDLSFLYALKETSKARNYAPAYLLAPSLSQEEELNLYIRGVTPLVMNMPSTLKGECFYVGLIMSLAHLCMDPGNRFEKEVLEFAKDNGLLRRPTFIALGLASHNTTGRPLYTRSIARSSHQYKLPKPGRRNLVYDAYDHPGGSALVACAVFSSLDWEGSYPRSLISVIGNDIYRPEVIGFCEQKEIDVDAIEATASETWSSTVVVHDAPDGDGIMHPGQRIFLDRGYRKKLIFGQKAIRQLRSQLAQSDLRLLYFDKFLALSYRYNRKGESGKGLLMDHKEVLDEISKTRKEVDILYETGGTGSPRLTTSGELTVESVFANNINILTAGFPFFVKNVLPNEYRRKVGQKMVAFDEKDFSDTEFFEERNAITDLLKTLNVTREEKAPQHFKAPREIIEGGRKWVQRDHPRIWLVVTLHDLGAITIDLENSQGVYIPAITIPKKIKNTAGAGDAFRGAFCYALLKCRELSYKPKTMMTEVTRFAVTMATRKCEQFQLEQALKYLREQSHWYDWSLVSRT